MMNNTTRDRVKKDFLTDYVDGKTVAEHFKGIGYSVKGDQFNIEVRIDMDVKDEELGFPREYIHETGNYLVNVVRIDKVRVR